MNGKWQPDTGKALRKRHGLQGPIDDAFLDSFLCVKPSAPNQRLDTFKANWDKFLRGDLRIKDASSVTNDDIRQHNLILFGDAATNKFYAKIAGKLPFRWTPKQIQIAGRTFDGEGQTLVAIYPNPLNPDRYIVLTPATPSAKKNSKAPTPFCIPA